MRARLVAHRLIRLARIIVWEAVTDVCGSRSEYAVLLDELLVDLILLDLKMPGKDGFEVLKDLEHTTISRPKVIVLTAYADVKSAIDSAKLGAGDFISKPYDFDELLITIRKVLQKEN